MLSGNLEKFNLLDVFQLLNMNSSIGCLEVVNGNKAHYQVYLQKGKIMHAEHGRRKGPGVVEKVLTLKKGYFNFLPDQSSGQITINKSIDLLMLETQARHDELQRLKKRLPSSDDVILFNPEQASDLTLSPEEWKVIAQIDGKRTTGEIIELMDDEVAGKQILVKLIDQGLIVTLDTRLDWRSVIPRRITDAKLTAGREFPPRLRTNILLKKIDGRKPLDQLLGETGSPRKEFFEDLFFLQEFKWIDYSPEDLDKVRELKETI